MKIFTTLLISLLLSSAFAGGMSEVDLLTREGIAEHLYQNFDREVDIYDQVSNLRFGASSEGCFFQVEANVRLSQSTELNCEVCFQGQTRDFWVSKVSCY